MTQLDSIPNPKQIILPVNQNCKGWKNLAELDLKCPTHHHNECQTGGQNLQARSTDGTTQNHHTDSTKSSIPETDLDICIEKDIMTKIMMKRWMSSNAKSLGKYEFEDVKNRSQVPQEGQEAYDCRQQNYVVMRV